MLRRSSAQASILYGINVLYNLFFSNTAFQFTPKACLLGKGSVTVLSRNSLEVFFFYKFCVFCHILYRFFVSSYVIDIFIAFTQFTYVCYKLFVNKVWSVTSCWSDRASLLPEKSTQDAKLFYTNYAVARLHMKKQIKTFVTRKVHGSNDGTRAVRIYRRV